VLLDPLLFQNKTYDSNLYLYKSFQSLDTKIENVFYSNIWKPILELKKDFVGFECVQYVHQLEDIKNIKKPVIIILDHQAINNDELASYISLREQDTFVINDYGYKSDNWYDIKTTPFQMRGYVNNRKIFVPHKDRKHLASALSSRFEPWKWLIVSYISLKQKNSLISFYTKTYGKTTSYEDFLESCKYIMGFLPPEDICQQVKELIQQAPIIPQGMTAPQPNGDVSLKRWKYVWLDVTAHANSIFNFSLEGSFVDTGYGTNVTEKMIKCLATGCFPIHVGQTGGYDYLRSMGFEGFEKAGIDLSYDQKDNSKDNRKTRMEKLFKIIDTLQTNEKIEDICKKNWEFFHNGWQEYCEKQNHIELDRLINKLKKI
jgi:hypothetical protein